MKIRKLFIAIVLLITSSTLFSQSSTSLASYLNPRSYPGPRSLGRSSRTGFCACHHFLVSAAIFEGGLWSRILAPGGADGFDHQPQPAFQFSPGTGNLFIYSSSRTTNGIPANAKLNLKSAGTAVDIYPFHKGFRISPGLLFYNANQATADASIPGGTSFTLNNHRVLFSATSRTFR